MNKYGGDAKVKKTLVRNVEKKTKPLARKQAVVLDMGGSSTVAATDSNSCSSQKENQLNQPSLCSSEALANYLSDFKKTPPAEPFEDVEKCHSGEKMTKKLNFHFNDRIYKNLIELNANINELKTKKDKRVTNSNAKRDLEPNIEDFCQDVTENDLIPDIPVIKPKFKPIRKVENGHLHKLMTSFEDF